MKSGSAGMIVLRQTPFGYAAAVPWKFLVLCWLLLLCYTGRVFAQAEEEIEDLDGASFDAEEDLQTTPQENICSTWEIPDRCGPPNYPIDLDYSSLFPPALKAAAKMAADYWSRALSSRPNKNITTRINVYCDDGNQTSHQIPGTLIFMGADSMMIREDGRGMTVAQTGILALDVTDDLPRVSRVDINTNSNHSDPCEWTNVLVHEFGHALGFGEGIPAFDKLLQVRNGEPYHFLTNSPYAQFEWNHTLNSSSTFPSLFPNDLSHWPPNKCFDVEIMLPVVYEQEQKWEIGDTRWPVSRLTLAVFADMGYKVNWDCADPYDSHMLLDKCRIGRRQRKKKRTRRKTPRKRRTDHRTDFGPDEVVFNFRPRPFDSEKSIALWTLDDTVLLSIPDLRYWVPRVGKRLGWFVKRRREAVATAVSKLQKRPRKIYRRVRRNLKRQFRKVFRRRRSSSEKETP